MKKYQYLIITLNLILIILCSYFLYEDYQRVGHFQWVDPNAVADDEELYLNGISVMMILLSLISVITQFNYREIFESYYKNRILIVGLNVINGFYGIFLAFIGAFFFVALLVNLGNSEVNDLEDGLFVFLMFNALGSFFVLGVLILRQMYLQTEGHIERKTNDMEDILDIEIGD